MTTKPHYKIFYSLARSYVDACDAYRAVCSTDNEDARTVTLGLLWDAVRLYDQCDDKDYDGYDYDEQWKEANENEGRY